MSASILTLREKFEKLLTATTVYFAEPQRSLEQDRISIEHLRELALLLVTEIRKPRTFERFAAYLLGAQVIQAQYPFHTVQMLCLSALALKDVKLKDHDSLEEVLLASYFADFGFRAAWLSFQNAHSGASVFHLRSLGLSWWSPWIERMILFHHDSKADVSPHRVLSVFANYLALTQRTGVDDAGQDVLTPARAVEFIMDSTEMDNEGKKYFLNTVSIYPLGSWVRLNNGQKGLVIGHSPNNPLRPTLGVFHHGESFGLNRKEAFVELIELIRTPTNFIVSESQPTAEMTEIFKYPELWIHGWLQATDEDETASAEPATNTIASEEQRLPADDQGWSPDRTSHPEFPTSTTAPMGFPVITNFIQSPQPPSPAGDPASFTNALTKPIIQMPVPDSIITTAPLREKPPAETAKPPTVILTSEELIGAASELAADIGRTLERLEVELHHLRHRGQLVFTEVPKELKKIRRALDEVRAFAHSLAGFGDPDTQVLTGALHIWEGEIAEAESQLHELRTFSTLFLDSWESKKRDAQRLLQSLHGAELVDHWNELRDSWRERLKPGLEETSYTLGRQWQEKQQSIWGAQSDLHRKLEMVQRTRELLVEKMALLQLSKGLRLRKEKAWADAIAAFQKALALNPSLWEAHTYLGLCHMEAAEESQLKRFRRPPAA